MSALVGWGIGSMGFVFGYMLAYSVKHTKEFSIDSLSGATGAVGGGAVIELFGRTGDWLGPYGVGLGVGFAAYMALYLLLLLAFKVEDVKTGRALLVSRGLLGKPREP